MIPTLRLPTQLRRLALILINTHIPTSLLPALRLRLSPHLITINRILCALPLRRSLGRVGEELAPRAVFDFGVVAVEVDVVCALHGVDADGTAGVEIEHGFRVELHPSLFRLLAVAFDQAARFLLIRYRRFPRLVDVFVRIVLEFGTKVPDEVALGVGLLGKRNGRIAAVELRVECCAGEPLPVTGVAGDFVVDEPFFKDFGATLPVNVAAATGEEAGDGVATEMVYPPFQSELAHQGVDPREACPAPFPAIKPGVRLGAIDLVVAGNATIRRVDFGWQMPGNEPAMAVSVCLSE